MTNETTTKVARTLAIEPTLTLSIGRVGEKAKFQGREVKIDLTALPEASVLFALTYGLKQYIADGTAGSEDQAGYDLGIDMRLRKLAEGDFTRATGERGPRAETAEGLALKNATAAIRAHLKARKVDADAKVIGEAARKQVSDNPKWLADARKTLAERAKLASELDLGDLFADIAGVGGDDQEVPFEE